MADPLKLRTAHEHIEDYLRECESQQMSEHTIRAYRTGLYHWLDSGLAAREYLVEYGESGVKAQTLLHRRQTLHTYWAWLVAGGWAGSNPLDSVKPPRVPKVVQRTLSLDECARLLDGCMALKDNRYGEATDVVWFYRRRLAAMVALQLTAGLRVSEMLNMLEDDINTPEAYKSGFVVVRGKGNKERHVRLSKTARQKIYEWQAACFVDSDYLFASPEGAQVQARSYARHLHEACWWAGIEPINPHMLRHTFATMAVDGGIPVADLQLMLGHSNVTTTMRYVSRDSRRGWHRSASHPLEGLSDA